jgi:drug/metabolite transporter (DMT)-like permease
VLASIVRRRFTTVSVDRSTLSAVALMLVTAIAIPTLNAIIKTLGARYPIIELLWLRYIGHLILMLILFVPKYGIGVFRTCRPDLQIARSITFCGGTFLAFLAIGTIPLPTVSAIQFTAPLMVTALAPFLLHERVRPLVLLAVAAGFAGALVVVRPGYVPFQWSMGLLFLSAAMSAVTQVLSRKLAGQDRPFTTSIYMVVLGSLISSLPLPFVWVWPTDRIDTALFLGLGITGGVGHYCLVRAFELAPASIVAPFLYMQIVTAAVLGAFVFGEQCDAFVFAGSLLIIASGLVVLVRPGK